MNAESLAGLAIAGLTLLWVVTTGILAVLVRGTARWSKTEERVSQLAEQQNKSATDAARLYSEIMAQVREDRRTTHERLTYIERRTMDTRGHA